MKPYRVGSFNFYTPELDELEEALRESQEEFVDGPPEEVIEGSQEGETLSEEQRSLQARPMGSFKEMIGMQFCNLFSKLRMSSETVAIFCKDL